MRNGCQPRISTPGKSDSRLAADHLLQRHEPVRRRAAAPSAAGSSAPSPGRTAPRRRRRAGPPRARGSGSRCTGRGAPGPPPAASAPGRRCAWKYALEVRPVLPRSSRACPGAGGRRARASAGSTSSEQAAVLCRLPSRGRPARCARSCSSGVRPSAVRSLYPAATCRWRPATRTWKNSSRLPREDRQELDPLEQRRPRVLRLVQHAPVELQPGEFAVEVQPGVLEIGQRCGGGDFGGRCHDPDNLPRGSAPGRAVTNV